LLGTKEAVTIITARISMDIAYAIPNAVFSELFDSIESKDKPSRVSISNDLDLKGGGAIEDAVKSLNDHFPI